MQVDSASTLITTAKNLMKAVVETVKTCYIASTAVSITVDIWKLSLYHCMYISTRRLQDFMVVTCRYVCNQLNQEIANS